MLIITMISAPNITVPFARRKILNKIPVKCLDYIFCQHEASWHVGPGWNSDWDNVFYYALSSLSK